nr:isoform 5 of wilms tumor protein like [Quercus suber]
MSVPPSRTDWPSVLPLEDTIYGSTSYTNTIGDIDQLRGPSAQYSFENDIQVGPQIALNESFDDPCAWSNEVATYPQYPPKPSSQRIGPLDYEQGGALQWQDPEPQQYMQALMPQAPPYGQEAIYNAIDPLQSQQGQLASTSQTHHLNIAAAPSPPDSLRMTPNTYPMQNDAMTAQYDLANTIFASTTRTPASLPPNATPEPHPGPPKRKRSFSDTAIPNVTAHFSPTPGHPPYVSKRPKLGLLTTYGPSGRCLGHSALKMCQYCDDKSQVAYATPSPQGPTSAPAEWLEGMASNSNWQLGQSTLSPGIHNWNRAARLPGEFHGVPAHASGTHLQPPTTPTGAAPSPTASSVASSARTLTKRNRDEMTHGAYRCPWANCGKGFASSNDLNHHQRYHTTGRRPHLCTVCGKDFLHLKDMRRHQNTHAVGSASKRHFCLRDSCRGKKGYSRKDHLARHMRMKHPAGL